MRPAEPHPLTLRSRSGRYPEPPENLTSSGYLLYISDPGNFQPGPVPLYIALLFSQHLYPAKSRYNLDPFPWVWMNSRFSPAFPCLPHLQPEQIRAACPVKDPYPELLESYYSPTRD